MAQQTAVEWLIDEIIAKQNGKGDSRSMDEIFEKAKEMDKQQKKDAWDRGKYIGESFPQKQIEPEYEQDAEQYYTQTYGK
jgi:hypothetical protein